MVRKLGPAGASLPAAWPGVAAVARSAQSPWQRSIRALWIVLVAILPLPLARKLIEMRYMPVRRPRSIEVVTRLLERGNGMGRTPRSTYGSAGSQRAVRAGSRTQ
jgi:hypothetical protein